jgi:hypothetical protein
MGKRKTLCSARGGHTIDKKSDNETTSTQDARGLRHERVRKNCGAPEAPAKDKQRKSTHRASTGDLVWPSAPSWDVKLWMCSVWGRLTSCCTGEGRDSGVARRRPPSCLTGGLSSSDATGGSSRWIWMPVSGGLSSSRRGGCSGDQAESISGRRGE